MSQLEIGAEGEQGDRDASTEFAAAAVAAPAAVMAPVHAMRPTFHGVMRGSSLLKPSPAGSSDVDAGAPRKPRHVGFQYLMQLALTSLPLIAVDLGLLAFVVLATRQLMRMLGGPPGLDLSTFAVPIATGFLLLSAELGLYPGVRLSPVEELRRLSMAVLSIFAVWIVGVAMLSGGLSSHRWIYLIVACLMYSILLPIGRGIARRALAKWSWWGFPTLVCGHDATAVKVYDWLSNNRRLGLRPVGVIVDREDLEVDDEPWYAGPWSAAPEVARQKGVYWAVVVPLEGAPSALGMSDVDNLSSLPHIHILSELTGLPDHWARHQKIDGLTGIHLQQNLMLPLSRMTKRVMDIVCALLGGLVLLPLLFYIAIAVKLSSRGPVLYANDRIGRDGKRFRMWKFRSMFINSAAVLDEHLDANPDLREQWETNLKLKYDPRITRIGRFIRATSLDELPQLWNVIKGEMSLVGPRPILLEEQSRYGEYFRIYTSVSPGITGLWQVSGRSNTSYEERLQLVAYYVHNWSLWLDIYLLLRTVRIVLFGRGAY